MIWKCPDLLDEAAVRRNHSSTGGASGGDQGGGRVHAQPPSRTPCLVRLRGSALALALRPRSHSGHGQEPAEGPRLAVDGAGGRWRRKITEQRRPAHRQESQEQQGQGQREG